LTALVLIGAAWLLGEITEDVVTHDPLLHRTDMYVSQWLHAHGAPVLTSIMLAITWLGSTTAIVIIALGFALLLYRQRDWYWLMTLALTLPCGMVINWLMKLAVQRPRPFYVDPVLALTTFSFPSGHAAGSTLLYGVLAAWFYKTETRVPRRALVIAGLVALVALIAFSRVYLGVHYLTDVVAGVLEGIVWLTACLTALDAMRRHQATRGYR
jgi:membrane-associated phospholipid phosphatase